MQNIIVYPWRKKMSYQRLINTHVYWILDTSISFFPFTKPIATSIIDLLSGCLNVRLIFVNDKINGYFKHTKQGMHFQKEMFVEL
jgi:hypothetical protein